LEHVANGTFDPRYLGWVNLAYLLASVLFIMGIKGLTHPRTAVRGNAIGALGMLIAILATFVAKGLNFGYILASIVLGSFAGAIAAARVPMTGMPEMVALFNGFGGLASTLVAGSIFLARGGSLGTQATVATAATGLIGTVTWWGSLVAYLKLSEKIPGKAVHYPLQQPINVLLGIGALACGIWLVMSPATTTSYWVLCGISTILGVTLVIPIGGADMPVVIALLNSYSGLAGATTGFVIDNNVLIIAGSLVGASGIILSSIMCKAMNRSLAHVLFGTLGPTATTASADDVYAGKVKATSPEEVAMLFDGAQRAVIVPGYGMAVSQAQHVVRDMANVLESRGCKVEYAIHPVAGRMPGHMNVLLAEADVPYDQLIEMDEINPTMATVDVCMVIGANDVVNPDARNNPDSPIAGMPIIDADKAHTVVVVKRSLSPGFAGIPNPLFAADNTLMMFGDGKKAIQELVAALKES
jgi:proton-translocating NAD(P)+ transhydrogenase subunit beta